MRYARTQRPAVWFIKYNLFEYGTFKSLGFGRCRGAAEEKPLCVDNEYELLDDNSPRTTMLCEIPPGISRADRSSGRGALLAVDQSAGSAR